MMLGHIIQNTCRGHWASYCLMSSHYFWLHRGPPCSSQLVGASVVDGTCLKVLYCRLTIGPYVGLVHPIIVDVPLPPWSAGHNHRHISSFQASAWFYCLSVSLLSSYVGRALAGTVRGIGTWYCHNTHSYTMSSIYSSSSHTLSL